VAVNYFADPTDTGAPQVATTWTGRVIVTDDDASASSAVTDTVEMGSLIALDVTSSIAYGTIALGATSSEQTTTITNAGNRAMDAEVSADGDMTCTTVGSVAVGQAKWSLSTGFVYASAGTALSTSATSADNSTAQRTGASTTTPLYWKVQLPSSGIKGSCSNSITFTAIADV
jgi:Flp pilus assembly CpaE family ATPase